MAEPQPSTPPVVVAAETAAAPASPSVKLADKVALKSTAGDNKAWRECFMTLQDAILQFSNTATVRESPSFFAAFFCSFLLDLALHDSGCAFLAVALMDTTKIVIS